MRRCHTHYDKNCVNLSTYHTHLTGYEAHVIELCLVFIMYVVHVRVKAENIVHRYGILSIFDLENYDYYNTRLATKQLPNILMSTGLNYLTSRLHAFGSFESTYVHYTVRT
jgi:hypothetical protein